MVGRCDQVCYILNERLLQQTVYTNLRHCAYWYVLHSSVFFNLKLIGYVQPFFDVSLSLSVYLERLIWNNSLVLYAYLAVATHFGVLFIFKFLFWLVSPIGISQFIPLQS